MEFFKEFGGLFTSIIALFLSIASIIIGVKYNRKTFKYQKNHDKLTTEPHLSVMVTFKEQEYSIELTNTGFGPAHVKSIKYIYKDIECESNDLYKKHFPIYSDSVKLKESTHILMGNKTIIGSGDSMQILNMFFLDEYDIYPLKKFLKEVLMVITYKSIYGEKKVLKDFILDKDAYVGQ